MLFHADSGSGVGPSLEPQEEGEHDQQAYRPLQVPRQLSSFEAEIPEPVIQN